MIKNFEEYINEDYFSKLANRHDNNITRIENEITEDIVRSYVSMEYMRNIKSITIRKDNNKTVVDIDGDFVLARDVEEIPFQFGKVTGDFDCSVCTNLKSLKGCPEIVGGGFMCSYCPEIESLEGAPQNVGDVFDCTYCKRLKSLEGCPKNIGLNFYCSKCCKKFTEEEVRSFCNVGGKVFV